MPPSLAPLSGFIIFTADIDYNKIEQATYPTLTNTEYNDETTIDFESQVEIVSQKQINKKNSVYKFSIFVGSDMPKDSYWTLTIPSEVGLPSQGTTDLSVSCQTQCEDSGLTLDWN